MAEDNRPKDVAGSSEVTCSPKLTYWGAMNIVHDCNVEYRKSLGLGDASDEIGGPLKSWPHCKSLAAEIPMDFHSPVSAGKEFRTQRLGSYQRRCLSA